MSWCCRRRGDAGCCPHRGAAGRPSATPTAMGSARGGGGRQPQIRCQRREFDILCQNLPVHERGRAVFRRVVVRDARQLAADVDAKACGRQGLAGRVAPRARRPTEDTAFSGAAVPHLPLQKVNGPGAWNVAGAEHECARDLGRAGHGKPQL